LLKGRFTALIISVVVHILLFSALVLLSAKQQTQTKIKDVVERQEIKSYLYRAKKIVPAQEDVIKPVTSPIAELAIAKKEPPKPSPKQVKKQIEKKIEQQTKITPVEEMAVTSPLAPSAQERNKPVQQKETPSLPTVDSSKKNKRSNALHNSLSRLRNSINQKLADDSFNKYKQVRSSSVMHGAQLPVPHSDVPLTTEEKHQKNTSFSHTGSITKHDDGTCTIVREQILGSPVEASVSSFACGESKFDKSFREHMKKVNDKLIAK